MKANKILYISFFVLIFVYVISIRLQAVPVLFSYILYGFSAIVSFVALNSRGFARPSIRQDVTFLLLFFLFYFISGIIYSASVVSNSSWILKDFSYSLIPMLFYLAIRTSKIKLDGKILLLLTWLGIIIIDVLSLMMYLNVGFNIASLFRQDALEFEGTIEIALSGIVGVIFTGFINVIGLIICVFSQLKINKIFKICSGILFVFCIFLTGQRTPIGGVLIIILVYLLKNRGKGLIIATITTCLLLWVLPRFDLELQGVSIKEAMIERTLMRFENFRGGTTGRESQYKIYIDDNVFEFFIGEGVGAHSPENPSCWTPMPDAMLFRILNEMGIVGLSLFLFFFYINLQHAIKKRNWFMIAMILYLFFANSTNRVLFLAPLSILPYFLLAFFNWRCTDFCEINEKRILFGKLG